MNEDLLGPDAGRNDHRETRRTRKRADPDISERLAHGPEKR